jgi:hypothetical protein
LDNYIERWIPEEISVFIDENGVQYFSWSNPLETVETMNESARLLPFEDIKQRIKQSVKNGFIWTDENTSAEALELLTLHIDKVQLTSVLLPIRDDLKSQYLAPAYIAYYRTVEEGVFFSEVMIHVFGINAIDGSYIELGYYIIE